MNSFQQLYLSARLMTWWRVDTLVFMKNSVRSRGAVGVQLQPVVSHGATMRKVR